jgi:uncharacterized coiled-coil protein SlyX
MRKHGGKKPKHVLFTDCRVPTCQTKSFDGTGWCKEHLPADWNQKAEEAKVSARKVRKREQKKGRKVRLEIDLDCKRNTIRKLRQVIDDKNRLLNKNRDLIKALCDQIIELNERLSQATSVTSQIQGPRDGNGCDGTMAEIHELSESQIGEAPHGDRE